MNIAQMTFKEFVSAIIIRGIIQPITTLLLALAILYFLWNVVQFIRKNDKPEEIEKFKTHTMWGIVAIFVMVSVWGLVQILVTSFVPGARTPVFNAGTSSITPNPNQYSERIGPNQPVKVDMTKTSFPVSRTNIDGTQQTTWYNTDGTQHIPISGGVSPWSRNSNPYTGGTPNTPYPGK